MSSPKSYATSDSDSIKRNVFASEQILDWLETIMKNHSHKMDAATMNYICSVLSKEEELSLQHYNSIVELFGRPNKSSSIFRNFIENELHSLGSYLM